MRWEASLLAGGAAGQLLLLNPAQSRHAIETVTTDLDGDAVAGRSAGIRRLLGQAWQLAHEWGIGIADLEHAAGSADTRYFARWAARFDRCLRDHGWLERASLTAALLAEPELLSESQPVVLAGFEHPNGTQRRLFSALDARGLIAGRLAAPANGHGPSACQVNALDPADERHRIAGWAAACLQRRPAASLGIIVPDVAQNGADTRRALLDAFDSGWRNRDGVEYPLAVDDGRRLADAGYAHTALLLLQIPDRRMDYREVGQLLRSPFIGGAAREADSRARLDLHLRGRATQVVDLVALSQRADDDAPAGFVAAIGRLLEIAPQRHERREPAAWLALIETLLREAGLGADRLPTVDEQRVRDSWAQVLEVFGTLGEVLGCIDFGRARRVLTDLAREQRLAPPAGGGGVQVLTPQDARDHTFDGLWISGMTSVAWPPAAQTNPLIPLTLQRDRGVTEACAGQHRERSLALIEQLIDATPDTIVSWPGRDGEEVLTPTPRIAGWPLLDPVHTAEWHPPSYAGRGIGTRGSLPVVPDPAPPMAAGERLSGGTRLLDLQSACPARAFFELRLGARELEVPPYALDARTRGQLAHKAAEQLYAGFISQPGLDAIGETERDMRIAAAIDIAIAENIPRHHPLATALAANERTRLTRLMHKLLERDRARGSFHIESVETAREITIGSTVLSVRLDRVDRMDNGARLVIDYKTGQRLALSKMLGPRPLHLQLPLYAVYGDVIGIAWCWLHDDDVAFSAMGADDFGTLLSRRNKAYFLDAAAWADRVADWRRVIENLLTEYRGGDVRIDLQEDKYATGQFAMLTRRWELGPPITGGDRS